jgi:hypothetical protein
MGYANYYCLVTGKIVTQNMAPGPMYTHMLSFDPMTPIFYYYIMPVYLKYPSYLDFCNVSNDSAGHDFLIIVAGFHF